MKNLLLLSTIASSLCLADFIIPGNSFSDNDKMLSPRNMGIVTQVNIKEGDFVKKGDLLLSIDSKEIDMKKNQLQNVLGIQQIDYENVKLNLQRYKRLYKEDMVSKYELEQIQNGYNKLKKVLEITKSQLAEIENQYKYLNVYAPNNGYVTNIRYKEGELSIPGHPAIMLSDNEDIKVYVDVPESQISKIKVGDEVIVAFEEKKILVKGKVFSKVPQLNMISHTSRVKIEITEEIKGLIPGMFAKVQFKD